MTPPVPEVPAHTPAEVFVSVHRTRKNDVGCAFTVAEREKIGDIESETWARVRYILPDPMPELQSLGQEIARPDLTERERWLMGEAWFAARYSPIAHKDLDEWFGYTSADIDTDWAEYCAEHAPAAPPPPALLPPDDVARLTAALAMPDGPTLGQEIDRGDALREALRQIVGPRATVADVARWLLAAHARVGGGA